MARDRMLGGDTFSEPRCASGRMAMVRGVLPEISVDENPFWAAASKNKDAFQTMAAHFKCSWCAADQEARGAGQMNERMNEQK